MPQIANYGSRSRYETTTPVVVTLTAIVAIPLFAPVAVYEHEPTPIGLNVNGPAPEADETLTMPPHVVVVSVKPFLFDGCVSVTLCVGTESPVKASAFGEATITAPATVGDGDGPGIIGEDDGPGPGTIGEDDGPGMTGDVDGPGAPAGAVGAAIGALEEPGGLRGGVVPPPPPPHAVSVKMEPSTRIAEAVSVEVGCLNCDGLRSLYDMRDHHVAYHYKRARDLC